MAGKGKRKRKFILFKKKELRALIKQVFEENKEQSFNYKQISRKLGIDSDYEKELVAASMYEMSDHGYLNELSPGKFKLAHFESILEGRVDMTAKGSAYVVVEGGEADIFVNQSNLNHALNGDLVKVKLFALRRRKQVEGEVIEILERKRETFVGTIQLNENFAFLVPDARAMPFDIFIPLSKLNKAKQGQKAVAKIIEWPKNAKNPVGEIIDVLGDAGNHHTEMHAILAEFELPYKFPEKINDTANQLDETISEKEIKSRRDFREIPTFTIDPKDAKDFDDALSFQKLKDGLWEVGIHIADVSHYVKPSTLLDKEAFNRATSVYLVDRVVPMLPEKLSNLVCSLRPNEEKLCYSAVFIMDDNANIKDQWFGRTIIKSDRRFTYEEAQEIIEGAEGDMKDSILKLHDLAQKQRTARFKNGSIAFERVEVKFDIDEDGTPLGVFFKESKEANQLIEEFMLLANKRVAEFIGKAGKRKSKTFVYRIHDEPNSEKLESFAGVIRKFGYNLRLRANKNLSKDINQLLDEVQGKGEQHLVETLAVRSMAKAKYSVNNIGHYGLAFPLYTHFTSPIRRYPDVMVHRLLDSYLAGGKSADAVKYEDRCRHCSEMEIKASNAERASIKYKQVEFLKDKIGEEFDGIISGVTDWGIYVELIENKCEGMVSIRDLDDDFYEFDEKDFSLVGRQSNHKYQLGDKVRIRIYRANLEKKQLDFLLVD